MQCSQLYFQLGSVVSPGCFFQSLDICLGDVLLQFLKKKHLVL